MYCLDCGQKIENGQDACSNCGMSVDEIKKRISEAQEKVTYAETVGPAQTTKLPPVAERVYKDKQGNTIDPAEELEYTKPADKKDVDIPIIGDSEDPYVTKPIPKIVSDDGQVVRSIDDDAKSYIQPPKKQGKLNAKTMAILSLVGIFVVVAIAAALMNSAGMLNNDELLEDSQSEQVEGQEDDGSDSNQSDTKQINIFKALHDSYLHLGSFREQVNGVVSHFNNYYLASNLDSRKQYANECNALIDTINKSKSDLVDQMNELGLDDTSPLLETYNQIKNLYDLLLSRLDVIKSCWDVSIASSDPKKDAEAILAPLSKDIKAGKSTSIAQFDELYPKVPFPEL